MVMSQKTNFEEAVKGWFKRSGCHGSMARLQSEYREKYKNGLPINAGGETVRNGYGFIPGVFPDILSVPCSV